MVLSNSFVSLVEVVTKPYFLLPVIGVLLISMGLSGLSLWAIERPLTDLVLYSDTLPSGNLLGLVFTNYPLEAVALVVTWFVMTVVGVLGLVSVARLARGDAFWESINDSFSEWRRALGLSAIMWAALLVLGFLLAIASQLMNISQIFGQILAVIIILIAALIAVKTVFSVPALAAKDAKKAIQESWGFTSKKIGGTIALIVVASVISTIGWLVLTQAGVIVEGALPAQAGLVEVVFSLLADSFASTYFVAATTNYFYSKQ